MISKLAASTLFLAALVLAAASPGAQAQEIDFAFGLVSGEDVRVRDLAVSATGDVLVTGTFTGTARLGNRELTARWPESNFAELFVASFDAGGALQWVRQEGAEDATFVSQALALDPDGNAYVAGWILGNASYGGVDFSARPRASMGFLARYTSDGDLAWVRRAERDVYRTVAVGGDSTVYVAGGLAVAGQLHVSRYSSNGELRWTRTASSAWAHGIAVDRDGAIYVAGTARGLARFGEERFGESRGGTNPMLLKFAPDGQMIWYAHVSSSGASEALAVTTDGAGQVVVTGELRGEGRFGDLRVTGSGNRAFVARYDTSGTAVWAVARPGAVRGEAVAVDGQGTVYAVLNTGVIMALAAFGEEGERWIQPLHVRPPAQVRDRSAVRLGPEGSVYAKGYAGGEALKVGSITILAGQNEYTGFVARLPAAPLP
jgi:outer membrane protein assembly factor BamB